MKKMLVLLTTVFLFCLAGIAVSAVSEADIPENYPYRGEVGNVTVPFVYPSDKPTVDGRIDTQNEVWGKYSSSSFIAPVTVSLTEKNMHPFWTYRSKVITEITPYYFFSDEGVYVAANIYDRTVQPSTGYDDTADIDHEGEGPLGSEYAFNGDTFIFCFDPLGTIRAAGDGKDRAPHYCITYYSDGTCHVARTRIGNDEEITSLVTASASSRSSTNTWSFEILIPWSVIVDDIESLTGKTIDPAEVTASGARSTANVIYADRCVYIRGDENSGFWKEYPGEHHNDGDVFMVSRSITVATVIKNDGHDMLGIYGSGDNVMSHGIKMISAKVCTGDHTPGETVTIREPDCVSDGSKVTVCSDCGMIVRREVTPMLGHTDSEWVVKTEPGCVDDGLKVKICPVCKREWAKETIPSAGGHTPSGEWIVKTYNGKPYLGVKYLECTVCGEIVSTQKFFDSSLWTNPYTDVPQGCWFLESAAFVNAYELMTGTSDTTFSPNVPMTRAMVVLVLGKVSGINTSKYRSSSFTDVQVGSWYAPYVQWAVEKGIVAGVGDLKFAPNDTITREQLAMMLYRYTEVFKGDTSFDENILDAFTDTDGISDYAVTAMKWAVTHGLISGMTEDTVGAKGTATRAQVSVIFMKYYDNLKDSLRV